MTGNRTTLQDVINVEKKLATANLQLETARGYVQREQKLIAESRGDWELLTYYREAVTGWKATVTTIQNQLEDIEAAYNWDSGLTE